MTLIDATASTFAWGFAHVCPAAGLLRVVKHEPDLGATPSQLQVHIGQRVAHLPLRRTCSLRSGPGARVAHGSQPGLAKVDGGSGAHRNAPTSPDTTAVTTPAASADLGEVAGQNQRDQPVSRKSSRPFVTGNESRSGGPKFSGTHSLTMSEQT
jgi:hypothetical protein